MNNGRLPFFLPAEPYMVYRLLAFDNLTQGLDTQLEMLVCETGRHHPVARLRLDAILLHGLV